MTNFMKKLLKWLLSTHLKNFATTNPYLNQIWVICIISNWQFWLEKIYWKYCGLFLNFNGREKYLMAILCFSLLLFVANGDTVKLIYDETNILNTVGIGKVIQEPYNRVLNHCWYDFRVISLLCIKVATYWITRVKIIQ